MTDPLAPLWERLRQTTQARIGLGRAGNSLPTTAELSFRAAHAAARDAVHEPVDVAELTGQLTTLGLGGPTAVTSAASSRSEFLRRPDLGRRLAGDRGLRTTNADVALVFVDGLSPRALLSHGVPFVRALADALQPGCTIAPPVIATEGRVAIGDEIGAALGVHAVVVIIGERPGLSVAESVGAYLTYAPRPGRADAERNCVSNIHPPDGLGYEQAAAIVAALVRGSFALGESGVRLKDRSRGIETAPPDPQLS